jgi:hypothetical protein
LRAVATSGAKLAFLAFFMAAAIGAAWPDGGNMGKVAGARKAESLAHIGALHTGVY